MRGQYFYATGSHLSAILKTDMARLRAAHPERYGIVVVEQTSMDGHGKVTTEKVVLDRGATPMSGRDRHYLATGRR